MIKLDKTSVITEITKYNKGLKPIYGRGTHKGIINCPKCHKAIAHVTLLKDNTVIGWFENVCSTCKTELDLSELKNFI